MEAANTISYGLYDQQNTLIDVGTSIVKNKEQDFKGTLIVEQDFKGTFDYYINVLVNGVEFPYELNGHKKISATKEVFKNKANKKFTLSLSELPEHKEVEILLFKYPVNQKKITYDTSLDYTVMALRYNIGIPVQDSQIEAKGSMNNELKNAEFIMLKPNSKKVELVKKSNEKTSMILGNNNDSQVYTVMGFLNGKQILIKNKAIHQYEVRNQTVVIEDLDMPSEKSVQENGHIFQLVNFTGMNKMVDGIQSDTDVNFSNPILIKNE